MLALGRVDEQVMISDLPLSPKAFSPQSYSGEGKNIMDLLLMGRNLALRVDEDKKNPFS